MRCRISEMESHLLLIVIVGGLLPACSTRQVSVADRPSSREGESPHTKNRPVDLGHGPVTTFEQACSRCHGPQGSFYGEHFAALADGELWEMVEEMMKGPAQLQPTHAQVDAMTAYHRALRDKRPFVCVTNSGSFLSGGDPVLLGEVTPGASVGLRKAGAHTPAAVDQMTWTVAQPPRPPFTLNAAAGQLQVQFEFPAASWSN